MVDVKKIGSLIEQLSNKHLAYRIKLLNDLEASKWSNFLIVPTPNYLETDIGPVRFLDIEYVDINPVEDQHIGRLLPIRHINHTDEILDILQSLGIDYITIEPFLRITLHQ